MFLPKIVDSSQFTVHSKKFSVNRGPITDNRKLNGFSLIELLVVITIIAVLIGAGTFSWNNAQKKSRDNSRKADLKTIQQALEAYLQENGKYPGSAAGKIICVSPYDLATINWGAEFACTTGGANKIIFLKKLPQDPMYQTSSNYYYWSNSNQEATKYTLSVRLENENDPDILNPTCTPQSGYDYNYCVASPK